MEKRSRKSEAGSRNPSPVTCDLSPVPLGIDDIAQWYQCVKCGEEMYFSLRATLAAIKGELDGHRCHAAIKLRGAGLLKLRPSVVH